MKLIKNIVLSFTASLALLGSVNAQDTKDTFTLKGEIKGLKGNLYFRHPDKKYTRETLPDSIIVTDGKFSFSSTISNMSQIRVYPGFNGPDGELFKKPKGGKGMFPVKSAYLNFYAFPGANVTVKGEATDFMNAYPSGDKFNNSLAKANKLMYPMYNQMGNLAVKNTYETDSVQIKANNKQAEAIYAKSIKALTNHIKSNPNSVASAWYLNDLILRTQVTNEEAEELFASLSRDLAEYPDYKAVELRINGIKATADGSPVPSIKTTATLEGKEFNINSLKGKYILIDFWGLWCGPCVAEMPQVKEFQEKHKDNLVVLGINSGDTKEKIAAFVTKNGYGWQQLLSDKANTTDNFVNRFNVQGFPTKFIIDRRGNIVKRFVGGGEEAFEMLEELLK
ncbi:thiol-disulfide isomerase/thioredoxin [Cellulophaga sp. RHA19]|uniref:TlpA disulfide reductase family protein n=1 Tax=Cellulophaga sp. RHA19 TaxID=1798237 RepID=UPI000C2BA6D8|nr:TlpA disulfide reductase family protein [Cellulophaga sp. RHA19]PKB44833.1 thiol-disulfide isomerase/thioredoxin [Cellulophaga sp. RHA19]